MVLEASAFELLIGMLVVACHKLAENWPSYAWVVWPDHLRGVVQYEQALAAGNFSARELWPARLQQANMLTL